MIDVLIGGAILGAIYALISLGLNLQYGVTRILNIAHGEFLMLGAFITYVFSLPPYNVNPIVSLAISGPLVFIFGLLIQTSALRRIVRTSKAAEELEFKSLLACFGLQFIIQHTVRSILEFLKLGYMGAPYLTESILIFGERFQKNMIFAAIASVIFSILIYLLLRFTKLGLAMRATVEEPTGAQLVGINILKIHAISFGLGVLLSALAGSMLCMIYSNLTAFVGPVYTFIALTVIIMGGAGSFVGSLLGGFFMGYVYYIVTKIDALLTLVALYALLAIILIVKPKGFFGR
ncbi:MAG: branched-chain amino acid ABC transporter permease [Nitrososphaerota archaeon]|nr:branched-chain amino acid ABC transporter permease [Candidatus Bathyarchaeota archaeon]MDW8022712.1 branched-chain amino acid ABC transporter permease [Nitrososphaerota archaeon]